MGLFGASLGRLLGGSPPAKRPSQARSGPNSTQFVPSQAASASPAGHAERKELLKAAMRELLKHNGIPEGWLSADLLRTTSVRREQGIHVRLLVRHWDPRLMLHGVALEQDFFERLIALDPTATDWLMGFSWQFNLPDASACPRLPEPATWTKPARPVAAAAAGPVAAQAAADGPPATRPADVIEGPSYVPPSQEDVRADLERLFALRDDDLRRHGPGEDGFAATRPVGI